MDDESVDELIGALRAASTALAALNETIVDLALVLSGLGAENDAQRVAAAACTRAGQQVPTPGAADPPDTF
jgi:hypothetical protein